MRVSTISLLLFSGLAFAASAFPVLTYSTYLRDSFTPKAIATDAAGNIYMAGNAIVDPATSQSTVLVVKLNPQASRYLYVRYLGGSVKDSANAIAVDASGNAFVAGATTSPDFPVTTGGNLGTSPGPSSQRSFVVKLDPSGGLVFSDLLGGSAASAAQAVAVNAEGTRRRHWHGQRRHRTGFPLDRGCLQYLEHRESSLFAGTRLHGHENHLLRNRNWRQRPRARSVR